MGQNGCHKGALDLVISPEEVSDRDALLELYTALNGPEWGSNFAWERGWPCWEGWEGVVCNETGRVIALELSNNRLKGTPRFR